MVKNFSNRTGSIEILTAALNKNEGAGVQTDLMNVMEKK
jgi:hypothetical protein